VKIEFDRNEIQPKHKCPHLVINPTSLEYGRFWFPENSILFVMVKGMHKEC